MSDAIEAAAIVSMAIQFSFDQEEAKSVWSYVGQATQDKFLKRAESIIAAYIAAYRDSEIEALRTKLADLLERHEAFVRAAKDDAIAAEGYLSLDGRMRNWAAFMAAQRIIALCDAELGKEQSNG